jgi:hypothetical protein
LIKEGKQLVRGGMSKLQAAKELAPRADGNSVEQKVDRLRKLF